MSNHSPVVDLSSDRSLSSPDRYRVAQRTTIVSAGVNAGLTVAQLLVGWLAHSQSLIAHGLHSFSDLLSDFLVLFANRQSNHPADGLHPYGHARVETAATLVLGGSLVLVGGGILWDAAARLQTHEAAASVEMAALWVAVATVFVKEGLYRYLIAIADRLQSKLMAANALHTRADAASALVVVAGVGGALLGWPVLDLVAASLMGFMILKLGAELGWGALRELIDEGVADADVASIVQTLESTPGVLGVHELRTRRMAHRVLADAHVQVDSRISVSEGHHIAELARARVLKARPEVLDVLVHIDAEDDFLPPEIVVDIPDRADIEAQIGRWLDEVGISAPRRVVLHYLAGRVEVEVEVEVESTLSAGEIYDVEKRLRRAAVELPYMAGIRICYSSPLCGADV